jgi:hypothetical protein
MRTIFFFDRIAVDLRQRDKIAGVEDKHFERLVLAFQLLRQLPKHSDAENEDKHAKRSELL